MRTSLTITVLLFLTTLALPVWAQTPISAMPFITSANPTECKVGDMVSVEGANLGQDTVAALYLTDGKNDIKVVMTEQTATSD